MPDINEYTNAEMAKANAVTQLPVWSMSECMRRIGALEAEVESVKGVYKHLTEIVASFMHVLVDHENQLNNNALDAASKNLTNFASQIMARIQSGDDNDLKSSIAGLAEEFMAKDKLADDYVTFGSIGDENDSIAGAGEDGPSPDSVLLTMTSLARVLGVVWNRYEAMIIDNYQQLGSTADEIRAAVHAAYRAAQAIDLFLAPIETLEVDDLFPESSADDDDSDTVA